jgi:hypothetical protein
MAESSIPVPVFTGDVQANVRTETFNNGTGIVHLHYMIPCNVDGASLILNTGGQVGLKVMVVGDGDKYVIQDNAANLLATITGSVTALQANAANCLVTVVQSNAANHYATVVQSNSANLVASLGTGTATVGNVNVVTTVGTVTNAVPIKSRQTFTPVPVVVSNTTNVTTLLNADATYGLDICSIVIDNMSNTATEVLLYANDGSTIVSRYYAPSGDMRGIAYPTGRELTQGAVNLAWKVKTVTAVTNVYVTPQYVKSTAWAI